MAEACFRCGTTTAETYRYCSSRKAFVCINCERGCEHYTRKLLPNGCNCKLTYNQPFKKYVSFLANPAEIESAKEKYAGYTLSMLKSKYSSLYKVHKNTDDPEARSKLRVELAALSELAEQRGA